MIACKVYKFNSNKLVPISYKRYKIDWKKAPSKAQQGLQDFLYPYWKNHIVLAEMLIPGSRYRCDMVNCNKRIILEYSPRSHHGTYNPFFHKNRAGYFESIKRDFQKLEWAEKNQFAFIELQEQDLKNLSFSYFKTTFNISLY